MWFGMQALTWGRPFDLDTLTVLWYFLRVVADDVDNLLQHAHTDGRCGMCMYRHNCTGLDRGRT
jgi:hypothetical protein